MPEKSNYVLLEYKYFVIEYTPKPNNRCSIRLASKIDMKMNYLPNFIMHSSAKKFAFDYFKNILKVSKKFKGSVWEKNTIENPEFYDFFKKKID